MAGPRIRKSEMRKKGMAMNWVREVVNMVAVKEAANMVVVKAAANTDRKISD